MQFSNLTGEEDGYDAGAIRIELFSVLLDHFEKRLFCGEVCEKIPKRADSPHYILLGMCIAHSLMNQGPPFLQNWAVDYLLGIEEYDLLLSQVNTSNIPKNAATIELIDFITKLEVTEEIQKLNDLIDENMAIINSSSWEPNTCITLDNKYLLVKALLWSEVCLKRFSQLRGIRDGLMKSGCYAAIKASPDIAKHFFMGALTEVGGESIINLFEVSDLDDDTTKEEARGYFDKLLDEQLKEKNLSFFKSLLKFTTGYANLPPHGIGLTGKIAVKFLPDDDAYYFPKTMSCLHVLSLPLVHSTFDVFRNTFLTALDCEAEGFSGE